MGRKLLHLLNGLLTCAVVVALVIAGAYAGYSLWDNQQVYNAAETVNAELKEIRATMGMPTQSAMEQMLEENRKAREARAAELAAAEAAAAQVTEAPTTAPVETAIPSVTEDTTTPAITEDTASAATTTETTVAETTPSGVSVSVETLVSTDIPSTEEKPSATEKTPDPVETTAPAETNIQVTPAIVSGTPVVTDTAAITDVPASAPAANLTAEPTEAPTAVPTPEPTEEPDDSPFGQLKAINPDITAWLTMPGTAIDYPVLQGDTNYSYINTDVYGNFALAGSIFLDSRNNGDYMDIYSLLYGHNMDQHRMFGDVNLYKEKEFFDENTLGMLLLPDGCHILESISIIVISASDSGLFNPENWTYLDGEGIYRKAQENAMFTCEKGLEALKEQIDAGMTPRLVALSTCSDEFTDARTILLTLMDP